MLYVCPISSGHINLSCAQYCILYQMHHYVEYSVSLKKNYKNKVKFLKNKVGEVSLILCESSDFATFYK